MKFTYLVLFSFLLVTLGVKAQTDTPVLMTEIGTGLKFAANAQSKWLKVKEPKVVSTAGRLKLNKTAQVTLYNNGVFKTLEGKGEYNLREVFQAQKQNAATEWQTQFNTFLAAADGQGQSFAKKLPADVAPIKTISPVAGKLATFTIQFYWQTNEEVADLKLELTDANGKVVHSIDASGGEAVVDPRKAHLFPGQAYSWRVFSSSRPELASESKTFQMNTLGLKSTLLPTLQEEKAYQEAPPFIQSLMEAAWFESKEWYFDADQTYRKFLEKTPENELYQQFYQAFLQRCGVGSEE